MQRCGNEPTGSGAGEKVHLMWYLSQNNEETKLQIELSKQRQHQSPEAGGLEERTTVSITIGTTVFICLCRTHVIVAVTQRLSYLFYPYTGIHTLVGVASSFVLNGLF